MVIEEHKIVANKILNDAIRIVRVPAERGELIHQYGESGFRLYELPAPTERRSPNHVALDETMIRVNSQ